MVDLGAAPGGWSQIAAQRVGAREQGRVIAIDVLAMEPVPGVDFIALDFLDRTAPGKLKEMIGGPADVVLSDMAANATGHARTDHLKIMALVEAAAEFAREVLAPGGTFLAKVLQGGTEAALLASLKRDYKNVKHVKPPASRTDFGRIVSIGNGISRRVCGRISAGALIRRLRRGRQPVGHLGAGVRCQPGKDQRRESGNRRDRQKCRRKIRGLQRSAASEMNGQLDRQGPKSDTG